MHTGKNVQTARHILGVKQESLASKLKINQQALSVIENRPKVNDVLLQKIAEALDVSADVIRNIDKADIVNHINRNIFSDNTTIG
jgi:transcriptional regulator with XRE-family HTH domain